MVRMLLTGRMDVTKMGRSWLVVDQRWSSKGVDCDILAQGFRIDRIHIPLRYTFCLGRPTTKNSGVKRVWPGAILRWVTDPEVFPGAHK
jgi:hypothetical protein